MIAGRKPQNIRSLDDAVRECRELIKRADRAATKAKRYDIQQRAIGRAKAYRVVMRWLAQVAKA